MSRAAAALSVVALISLAPLLYMARVSLGVGNALPSLIQTPFTSCSSPHGFATDVAGSVPIRHEPI